MEDLNIYYVYIYYDTRVSPPLPIYVGKGKKNRIYTHLRKKGSHNPGLKGKINHIRELGLEPYYEFYKKHLSFKEAMEIETALIKNIGRLNNNSGPLCNLTDGG